MATSSRTQLGAVAGDTLTGTTRQTILDGKSPSSASRRPERIFRHRLLDTIQKAIGREIAQRNENIPINPTKDDEAPPNLYKWQFSSDYPSFPKGGLTRWPIKDQEACAEALDQGWLSVVNIHDLPGFSSSHGSILPDLETSNLPHSMESKNQHSARGTPNRELSQSLVGDHSEGGQFYDITSHVLGGIRHEEIGELVRSLAAEVIDVDNISGLQESCEEVEQLILRRTTTLQSACQILEMQLRSLSTVKGNLVEHTKTKIDNLKKTIIDQTAQYQQLERRYEGLQKEFISATEEIKDLTNKLGNQIDGVAEARRFDELEDLRTAIHDLRKKRDVQEEEHLVQLSRVREESFQKGFRQGEAGVSRNSGNFVVVADLHRQLRDMQQKNVFEIGKAKEQVTHLEHQIEDIQAKNLIEVVRAREEGRREDEELAQLLGNQNSQYRDRKRREMRAIYHNWKNIPQNILSKSMMPEETMPSDKKLVLLARLSRVEKDPQKVKTLLEREIEQRNAQLPTARRDLILTSSDIEKVLASTGDEPNSQSSVEMSSTPQPVPRRAPQVAHDLETENLPLGQDRRSNQSTEYVWNAACPTRSPESILPSQPPSLERRASSEASEYIEMNNPTPRQVALRRAMRIVSRHRLGRLSTDQTSATGKHKPQTPTSVDRTSRRNFPNSGSTAFGSREQSSDLTLIPAKGIKIPAEASLEMTNRTIHDEIELLPLQSRGLLPSTLQDFPMAFIRSLVGGGSATFSKCGQAVLGSQIVSWPDMIKLNPDTHPLYPSAGSNGALTFVDGQPNTGEVGKTYPTLLKENVGFYQYIGHYRVIKRITMPVTTWKACKEEERIRVAEEIEGKEWGQALLRAKGLCINATDREDKRIKDILGFFESPLEPFLRISWTLLQFMSFEQYEFNILLNELKDWERADDNDGEAESVRLENAPRKTSADDGNPNPNDIETPSQLGYPRIEPVQESTCRGSDDQDSPRNRIEVPQTNKNNSKPICISKVHAPTVAIALMEKSLSSVPSQRIEVRKTIPSSTYESEDFDAPEYLSEAEDGHWRIHVRRSPQIGNFDSRGNELTSLESPKVSVLIKSQSEDEEDLYGVSPPRQTPVFSEQLNVARLPKRKIHEIMASFSNSKRQKADGLNQSRAV